MPRLRLFCLFVLVVLLAACVFPPGNNDGVPTAIRPLATLPPDTPIPNPPTPDPNLPLPTAPATTAPLPTATYDAGLADWTILVYLDADNNLELPGLLDLNEMEAAGSSEQVNVLVQIDRALGETAVDGDWTDTRRYRIQGDDDPETINSEPLQSLGEQNMGDPRVLADFLTWGIETFPANRYALILWDHGAGWNGVAFDGDAPALDAADHISLADLESALAQALDATGLPALDVIGFDACLMGQLDVLQAVQPYARTAVGSEELTPGLGWDYESLLRTLYAAPDQDGAALATKMVRQFVDYYTLTEPNDFVTMAAVDLARLPNLTLAVERLAALLTAEPNFVASAVGDARSGAGAFARVYAEEFDRYAAVDLHHFASVLAQRSQNETIQNAARDVATAVENAVLANGTGAGFKASRGVAIYFPRNAQFYRDAYAQTTQLTAWNGFLTSYHDAGLADLPPPQVHISSAPAPVVGQQDPAYVEFQVIGRRIDNVVLIGGRYEEDGRLRLLEYDNLNPEPALLPDGSELRTWRDGVHDDFFIWDTEVTYLYDAEGNGDFVVMWPTDPDSTLFTVQGQLRRANGDVYRYASLVFDHRTASLMGVWSVHADENQAPAEILPQPGDEFRLYDLYYNEDGTVEREPGPSLFFDEAGRLYFEWRPLPDGPHFLGFQAKNAAGATGDAFIDLAVANGERVEGYEAYLDPYLGFQFLYPETWFEPRYEETLLYTSQRDDRTQLQITIYPNLAAGTTVAQLRDQTLAQFGPVDVLFENEGLIAGQPSLRIAYGYNQPDEGEHTGIFHTFIHEGTGFVLDVDGLTAEEETTIAAADTMAASWRFKDVGVGLKPGQWAQVDLDRFTVAQPANFAYQEVGAWQRFNSGQFTFVALRTQPASLDTAAVVAVLVRDAGANVAGFESGDPFAFPLSGEVWTRVDFSYTSEEGGTIWGFIMARVEGEQEIVAWAEAPSTSYNDLETAVFLTMITDLELTNP